MAQEKASFQDWKPKVSDLGHKALNELVVLVAKELLDKLGATRTLEVLKPIMRQSGWALSQNMNGRFHIEGDEVEAIAFPYWAARRLSFGGKANPIKKYEHGAVFEILSCPLEKIPPEFCILAHFGGEGVCECVNNEYEIVFTSHLTGGGSMCRGVVRKKSDPNKDLQDLGKLVGTLEDVSISDEERNVLSTNMECNFLILFIESLTDSIDEQEVIAALEPKFREKGRETGIKMLKFAPKGASEQELLTWLLKTVGYSMDQKTEGLRVGEGNYRFLTSGCFFVHGPRMVCVLIESFIESFCQAAFPSCVVRIESRKPDEGGRCALSINMKRPEPTFRQTDAALEVLRVRYAKGEISEEELEKKAAHLRKLGLAK